MSTLKDGVIRRGTSWSYVIRVTDASGASKPRWVGGFPSEAAAKAARDAARVAVARGEFVVRSGVTVSQYLDRWLEAHALEVKPKTHEDYRSLIATYVQPRIGTMRLQAVKPSTLSSLYRTLLAEGGRSGGPLSARTVGYVHAVLRKAFNDAVLTDQLIASNPAERAKRPRATAPVQVREVWDASQLMTFLAEVETHRLFPSSASPRSLARAAANCCTCGGRMSTSTARSRASTSAARRPWSEATESKARPRAAAHGG